MSDPSQGRVPSDSITSGTGFFRDLAETIREAMYVMEIPSRTLSYVNPAYVRLFGVTMEQMNSVVGFWRRLVHPDDQPVVEQIHAQVGNATQPPPYRIRSAAGDWRWVQLRQFPRRDADGNLVRIVALVEDITQQHADAARSRELDSSLRRIIEVVPVGILAYRQGTPIFANSVLAQQVGAPVEELLAMRVSAIINLFFREDEKALGRARLQQAREGRDLPPVERHLTTRKGEQRVVEIQTITVELDGAPAQVTVVRDLTEQRRLEAQVAQADRMASLGRIAAGVAHELNNPLAYVLGNLEVARESLPAVLEECRLVHAKVQQDAELAPRVLRLTEQLQELLAVVRDASEGADRVRGIMRDLKSFSRPDTDDRREPVDVGRPLDAAVRMAWREIQPRARLVQDRQAVPLVLGIEGRLCQVFLNLLVNAAEAMPEGESHTKEVHITTRTGPAGEAVVEIADTGPGIAPEQLAHLFEPFFTTKGPGRGTGLGLSICHDIVRAHGGTITVESALGEGARFIVTLPAALVAPRVPLEMPTVAGSTSRRGTLLIIDDEPQVAATLRQLLGRDHDVTVMYSAADALSAIESGVRFDVIFCDVMMPGMSGMALHQALMPLARDQCDRIVFMTGGAFSPVIREFLGQVPNRQLEKPFTVREVRAAVAELLH